MVSPSVQFHVGEILWVDFAQRIPPGHEQLGWRSVIVVAISQLVQLVLYLPRTGFINWDLVTLLRKT